MNLRDRRLMFHTFFECRPRPLILEGRARINVVRCDMDRNSHRIAFRYVVDGGQYLHFLCCELCVVAKRAFNALAQRSLIDFDCSPLTAYKNVEPRAVPKRIAEILHIAFANHINPVSK